MTRSQTSFLLGLGLLGLVSCAGKLDNAEDFPEQYYPPGQCVVESVFYRRCGGSTCHNNTGLAAGSLILASPKARDYLIDKKAQHTGLMLSQMSACPTDDLYVDTANPDNSWLWKKVDDQAGGCGLVMPPIGSLSKADKECIRSFIIEAAANAAGGSSGAGGTAGAGTSGTGGTAGTGG